MLHDNDDDPLGSARGLIYGTLIGAAIFSIIIALYFIGKGILSLWAQ